MTPFDWLKALQSGVAITAFVLLLICGHVLWRYRADRREGYALTCAVSLVFGGLLLQQGWQSMQYWVMGVDGPVQTPTHIRMIVQVFFLTGGALFISITQQQTLSVQQTFVTWSMLIAMLIVMIALAG